MRNIFKRLKMPNKFLGKDVIQVAFYLFLIVPFFEIPYLSVIFPFSNFVYNCHLIVSSIIAAVLIIFKRHRWSKLINFIALFLFFVLGSTLINGGDVVHLLQICFRTIFLSLIIDYGLSKHSRNFLLASQSFFVTLIVLNLLSFFLAPSGLYTNSTGITENWLLGYRNHFLVFILPTLLFSFVSSYQKYGELKIKDWVIYLLSLITIILTKSSTAIVFMAIIGLYLLLRRSMVFVKISNIKNLLIIYVLAYFWLVIFRIHNSIDDIKYIIVNLLHRSVTLTSRTYIWDQTFSLISKKPLLGYGLKEIDVDYGRYQVYRAYHAHNEILEIIYQAGIVGLLVFIPILVVSYRNLWRYRHLEIARTISMILFALLVVFLTESYSYEWILYPFVLTAHINRLNRSTGVKHV